MTHTEIHDFMDAHFGGLDWNRDRRPPIELPLTGDHLDKLDPVMLEVTHLCLS